MSFQAWLQLRFPIEAPENRPFESPPPTDAPNYSVVAYVVLLNGYEKCCTQSWWSTLDPYSRDFLEKHGKLYGNEPGCAVTCQDNHSTTWKEMRDGDWRWALFDEFEELLDKSGDTELLGRAPVIMYAIYLGCFWAVSHMCADYNIARASAVDPQVSVTSPLHITLRSRAMLRSVPGELVSVGDVARRFQVAAKAFHAIRQSLDDYRVQERPTEAWEGVS